MAEGEADSQSDEEVEPARITHEHGCNTPPGVGTKIRDQKLPNVCQMGLVGFLQNTEGIRPRKKICTVIPLLSWMIHH